MLMAAARWALGLCLLLGWLGPGTAGRAETWQVPPGFSVTVLATGLGSPAALAFGPDGTLYLTEIEVGRVLALPRRGSGYRKHPIQLASELEEPLGVAWHQGSLYVAHTGRITRFRLDGWRVQERKVIVAIPLRRGGHNTNTVRVGPGEWLYVTQGSSCNVCVEREPQRAALLRYRLDGGGGEIVARGLRNCFGFDFHPHTGEIWGVDNGRDWLGEDVPSEELVRIVSGGHYGWPYCYGKGITDTTFPPPDPGFCRTTVPSVLDLVPHGGAAGVAFYTGRTFPPAYSDNLFVAMSGSWNRSVPSGYEVGRVIWTDGQPPRWETFLRHSVLTRLRPVGVAVGPDGALYVSDIGRGGRILRVQYRR